MMVIIIRMIRWGMIEVIMLIIILMIAEAMMKMIVNHFMTTPGDARSQGLSQICEHYTCYFTPRMVMR